MIARVRRIAVTGSTGMLGTQVVQLLAADNHPVIALARTPAPAAKSVTSVYADYTDLDSLRSALRGIDTLVFISSDGEAARMMVHHQNVVRAAAETQVGHVVYLSGVDADLASPFCYAYTNGYTEHLLAGIGCAVSIARASIYTEFFMAFLRRARMTGEIRLPAASGRISLVSREDVGRCLAALATAPPTGRHHDITGPAALALDAIAKVAGAAWKTPIRSTDVRPAEFAAELADGGEEPWWTYAYSSMFASIREHRWEATSDEVLRLTGRAPIALADLLAR
jgi:NAD(P)H dehydrogenase (quinone)